MMSRIILGTYWGVPEATIKATGDVHYEELIWGV